MNSETSSTGATPHHSMIHIKLPEFLTKPLSIPEKFTHQFARQTQSLAWFTVYPILKALFKIEVTGSEHLKNAPASLLIVSNHFSPFDGFFFYAIFKAYCPQFPLRFIAVNKFDGKFLKTINRLGIVAFIYTLFSVLVVTIGAGIDKNLEGAKRALNFNQSVVIYPEGGFNKDGSKLLPFKKGAAVLGIATGKEILPIIFKVVKKQSLRRTMKITIGQTFKLEKDLTYEEGTDIIYKQMSEIY